MLFAKTERSVLFVQGFHRHWSFVFAHCPQPGNKPFDVYSAKRSHWDLSRKKISLRDLNGESLMRGPLPRLWAGSQEQTGVVQHPGQAAKGSHCHPSKRWSPVRVVIMEEGPHDRSQSCEGT